jgi:pre-mRNA-processing factor 19
MLAMFQDEWDALMLETYTLKQNLDTARQELSHSLYQHDAACRVIARLTKERDAARAALATAQADISATASAAQAMDMDAAAGIPAPIVEKMASASKGLSKGRKKRPVPPSTATAEQIAGFSNTASTDVHGASKPGVLCASISSDGAQVVTGGADGTAVVTDRASGQVSQVLTGHSKKVTDVLFHPSESTIFTSSADKTARVWSKNGNEYSTAMQLKCHSAEVTGATLHATGDYLVTASLDETWAFWDIHTGSLLLQKPSVGAGYSAAQFHPDGLILATGTVDAAVRIWDIKGQQNVHTFDGHQGQLNSISFSENGYYMATCAQDNCVKLWDLRKLKNIATINADGAAAVDFDFSGQYLASAAGKNITVYHTKSWEVVKTFEGAHSSNITDVKWGQDAKFLVSTAMDRALKFFS